MDVSNCRHLIEDLLSQYVDGELDAPTSQKLELHMQICPPCAAFLRTFMATKRCARQAAVGKMDESVEASLWDFLEREMQGEIGACGHDHGANSSHGPGSHEPS
jgi:anti-sigma factor RsiW